MNHVAYFEIQADDPDKSVRFYSEIFGWRFTKLEGLPVPYWRIEGAGPNGGLLKRPANTPPLECGTNAYVCSIEVDDFDVTAEKILNWGGQIALPKFAIPGLCWQGYFIDPDGNTFGVFQPDARAQS
jgi:uncharacterized protein